MYNIQHENWNPPTPRTLAQLRHGGRNYGSPCYLAYHLKKWKTLHLSISPWNNIFGILSPNLDGVLTWIVITFYEPILTKFMYKNRFIPDPFLINSLLRSAVHSGFNSGADTEFQPGYLQVWKGTTKIKNRYIKVQTNYKKFIKKNTVYQWPFLTIPSKLRRGRKACLSCLVSTPGAKKMVNP